MAAADRVVCMRSSLMSGLLFGLCHLSEGGYAHVVKDAACLQIKRYKLVTMVTQPSHYYGSERLCSE